MIIRELHDKDLPELSALARKTYTETFGHTMSLEELNTELETTRSEKYFKSIMDNDVILVAVTEDRLAGYIQICDIRYNRKDIKFTDRDQAIHAIYIHSDFQGKRIGRTLMDAAFQHPRIKSAENVFIDVFEENFRAVNFYHKYGFEDVGHIPVEIDGKLIGYDLVLKKTS
jgi:ribosomal protein S18 acetylase RimI-like enzyme